MYDECLIVAGMCETVLPYHILQKDDIVNCIISVPCVIILSRHPIPLLDGEFSSVLLDTDLLV